MLDIVIGIFITWLIAHYYYKRANKDQATLFGKLPSDLRQWILLDKREHLSVKDLNSLIWEKTIDLNSKDQFPFKVCPKCGSKNLTREPELGVDCDVIDREPVYYKFDIPAIQCPECGWRRTEEDIHIGLLP